MYAVYTLVQKEDKHFLHNSWYVSTTMPAKQKYLQIQRNRGRRIIKFIDDLSKMQSTEFTCPQRRNEFWQRVYAIITYQSLPEEWVVKIVNEDGNENCSQKNTPRHMGSQNSNVSSMPRETESNLQTWNFDPIPSESRNWPDENLQGQAVHEKN